MTGSNEAAVTDALHDPSSTPTWMRRWDRIPVIVRSVLAGLVVFMALQFGWGVVVVASLGATPSVPWHVPAGLVYLGLVFLWVGGRGAPAATSERRRWSLRARALSGAQWQAALPACGATILFIIAFAMVNYRLIAVPEESGDLSVYPWWTIYPTLLMVSLVAGVSEEAGFRGYMQRPLEKRYGAGVAIAVSALMFWVAHFNHPSGVARGPSLLVMGIVLGAMAFSARSIWPPLITHAVADSIVFVGAQAGVGPEWLWSPPLMRESGLDGPFLGTLGVALAAGVAAAVALRRLRRATSTSVTAGSR